MGEKKEFLPGSGQGGGRCHPPVAVEAESNMENSILWRQPKEEDTGGLDLFVWEHGGAE